MNFNFIATLLAAVTFTFTAAVTDEKVGKGADKGIKLAAAPPVRGGKKQQQQHYHRSSFVDTTTSSSKSRSSSSAARHSSSHSRHGTNSSRRPTTSSSSSIKKSRSSRPLSVLESSSSINEKTKICTRELEAILYSPQSTVKDYLSKIADEMRADIQVIMAAFAGGNLDYLRTYVNKYNILITLYGPFGQPVLIASDFVAYTDYLKNVAVAQTYSGRDGFYVDTASQYYNYQFTLMSINGQLISFILSLPLSAMTNTPTYCNK